MAKAIRTKTGMQSIKDFFGDDRKVTLTELKALSPEDRADLATQIKSFA